MANAEYYRKYYADIKYGRRPCPKHIMDNWEEKVYKELRKLEDESYQTEKRYYGKVLD